MNIAIDLDDTLITNSYSGKWKLKKDAIRILPQLRDIGYQFHIITARIQCEGNERQISKILNALDMKGIPIKSVTYTAHAAKGYYAKQKGCTHLIDDCIEYLSDCILHRVIPIHLVPGKKYISCDDYYIAYSWDDVYRHLT